MEALSPNISSSVSSSPYSSPNLTALLKIKIISWSQETGLPVAIQVQVADRIFSLHKVLLSSRSGYFKRHLQHDSTKIELPSNFPGGSEVFEMIALFIYGSSTFIDPFNVAALRCASEFLEMTSDYGSNNLCDRTDLYLNQVVLQNWDDTLIVLQKCQSVLSWAEELLLVSRCIEALAFMACMEILDPEGKRDKPGFTFDSLTSHPWSSEKAKEIVCQDLWIKDLITLPFEFFKRVVCSLRRQGMREKYVSPIIVFYANKWIISKKPRKFWECLCDGNNGNVNKTDKLLEIFRGILGLLPAANKASKVIPVGFYFSLLARSIELDLESKSRNMLLKQIVLMLPSARIDDLFVNEVNGTENISSTLDFSVMINIFSAYVSSNMETDHVSTTNCSVVAELWDSYLCYVALDTSVEPDVFLKLIQTVPVNYRQCHDGLYRAITAFLQAHQSITQEEKNTVCQHLNSQMLSQEACIEAVQNELMPLRLIVQALFIQQLNTQQAFKECSESFRYRQTENISGSISSSRHLNESPYGLSCLLQKDVVAMEMEGPETETLSKEYESTSFRIQSLEKELLSLKKSLDSKTLIEKSDLVHERSLSKRRNPFGQVSGCIGSVSFSSNQRRYAGRILRVFRRMMLFGKLKQKRRSVAPSLWSKSV